MAGGWGSAATERRARRAVMAVWGRERGGERSVPLQRSKAHGHVTRPWLTCLSRSRVPETSHGHDPPRYRPLVRRPQDRRRNDQHAAKRSEEHTSELQSLMRISYAAFCLKQQKLTNLV